MGPTSDTARRAMLSLTHMCVFARGSLSHLWCTVGITITGLHARPRGHRPQRSYMHGRTGTKQDHLPASPDSAGHKDWSYATHKSALLPALIQGLLLTLAEPCLLDVLCLHAVVPTWVCVVSVQCFLRHTADESIEFA